MASIIPFMIRMTILFVLLIPDFIMGQLFQKWRDMFPFAC